MTRLTLADCFDPDGERFGIPTYPWRCAPDGLATRRQLPVRDYGRAVKTWRRRSSGRVAGASR